MGSNPTPSAISAKIHNVIKSFEEIAGALLAKQDEALARGFRFLRGAGDTRFVTVVSIALAWPVMVLPTWLAWREGWGLEVAWSAATAYIASMAAVFVLRFRGGKWRTMKVIEAAPADPDGTPAPTGEAPPSEEDDPAKLPAA